MAAQSCASSSQSLSTASALFQLQNLIQTSCFLCNDVEKRRAAASKSLRWLRSATDLWEAVLNHVLPHECCSLNGYLYKHHMFCVPTSNTGVGSYRVELLLSQCQSSLHVPQRGAYTAVSTSSQMCHRWTFILLSCTWAAIHRWSKQPCMRRAMHPVLRLYAL